MKRVSALFLAIALLLLMPVHAFAAGGNGSGGGKGSGSGGGKGDGSGGGSDEALTVEAASIEDGACITSEDTITLVFSKNVCHKTVRENNAKQVVVTDSAGGQVAVDVILCDDQVEPDKKNDIQIVFTKPLAEGSYTLTAKAGITSKSEAVMAEDFVLRFTVSAAEADKAPAASTEAATTTAPDSGSGSVIWIGVIGAVAVAGGVLVLLKKKHK